MALWNYNPYSAPSYRDPWGLFEPEPLGNWDFWPETSLMVSPFDLPRRTRTLPFTTGLMKLPPREVLSDKEKYQVTLHLGDFKTNEIGAKVVDGSLVINAEHEEKEDDHGHVYRRVNRRYILPRNVDLDKMCASLADDGTLVVCVPKKPLEEKDERNIEIKKLPPNQEKPQISQKSEKTGQGKVNIPVSHEKTNK